MMTYIYTFVVMLVLDAAWLFTMAPRVYKPRIGHLMSETTNFTAAGIFYLLYGFGVTYLVINPALKAGLTPGRAALNGALFGLVAYATYDLTNQATLKNWPVSVTLIDLAWGTFLTGITVFAVVYLTRNIH